MKRFIFVALGFFLFPVGILNAAPRDTTWILTDDTLRCYNDYSVCDTERDPLVGDSGCLIDNQTHCDTGAKFNGTSYINFDYHMRNGYAGFKIDWDAGCTRYDATGFDSLILYHKGPSTGETVTINFGASSTCGAPTIFTRLGSFSGSNSWKRESLPLPAGTAAVGIYEMQVLINNQTNPTASGNFKLDNMCLIKTEIKLQRNAPLLSSPANGVLKQPLKVTLAWSQVPVATSYALELSSSSEFVSAEFIDTGIFYFSNTIYSQGGITATSKTVAEVFAGNKQYYWRVRAVNSQGQSPWSAEWGFTTAPVAVNPDRATAASVEFRIQAGIIDYTLKAPGAVEIAFADIRGRTMFTLSRSQTPGCYRIEMKNLNLAPGWYTVKFKAPGIDRREKVLIDR